MADGLNVWTVLWTNGEPFVYSTRPADKPRPDEPETRLYSPEDVRKAERMVRRFLPDCTFRCLSNVDVPGIECVPLTSGMTGWWPKMELFRPDLPTGRNFYFDLDLVLIRDIGEIVSYPAPFAAIEPGKKVGSDQKAPWVDQEGFWRVPRYQTSIMVWDSEYGHRFWNTFKPEHKARLASDQDYLGEVFPDEARMPTEWFTRIRKMDRGLMPPPPVKAVLTMPYRNDEAARRYRWIARLWH